MAKTLTSEVNYASNNKNGSQTSLVGLNSNMFTGDKFEFEQLSAAFKSYVDRNSLMLHFKMLRLEGCSEGRGLGYSKVAYVRLNLEELQ